MVRRSFEEFKFLQERALELSSRYAGQYVAFVGQEIAGSGQTAQEAYEKAKQKYPHREPVLKYFPPTEAVLVL
uniref:DUF5678 domain-containing protein n=2 Tax=Candidatus Bipolaricaulota TaxID=67810 RepID=H5SDH0_9BACT|nr:hypothetical protein HGMM_F13E04C02 [uncultured Acetothermia bacterium]BAL58427.1 hypothetical protein HGMM_OP1C122 [Candidatus Acetothermum autotrophicum]